MSDDREFAVLCAIVLGIAAGMLIAVGIGAL